jgi:kinesin family protein 6/9
MTYGQTGSGKTFTMTGDTRNFAHRGISPRAISHIFNAIAERPEIDFHVSCVYYEIYNEKIYDLLDDLSNSETKTDFQIAEEKNGRGTFVRGLNEVPIHSEQECLNYLYSGELARTTSQHKLNRASNRSHSLLTIYIQQRAKSGVSERIVCSKLNLVDLAGSERLKKTMDDADGNFVLDETTKKESMYINQSLTYLEQCVVALSKKSPGHVPYRQTKLTNVLKDSIGGNCNTLMFANMWGESAHLEETISTLRLAARMMRVQNETKQNEVFDDAMMVKKLSKEVKELKQELLMHDAMVERSGVTYDEYTPEQKLDMRANIEKFLLAEPGSDEEYEAISFSSVRQMRELLFQFKKIAREKDMHIKRATTAAAQGIQNMMNGTGGFGDEAKGGFSNVDFGDAKDAVGDVVGGDGFGFGKADPDSRPGNIDEVGGSPARSHGGMSPSRSLEGFNDLSLDAQSKTFSGTNTGMQMASETFYGGDAKGEVPEDKEEAFALYKRTKGRAQNGEMVALKAEVKQIKGKTRLLASECNESKEEIDALTQKIASKKEKRMSQMQPGGYGEEVDVVDQEEFDLMRKQRDAKKAYKVKMTAVTELRNKAGALQMQVDDMKYDLLEKFDQWHGIAIGSLVDDGGGGGAMEGGEVMDDAEMFEKMELERIAATDPDSVAFFQAQKTRRANQTQNSLTIRQMGKNKRSVGV